MGCPPQPFGPSRPGNRNRHWRHQGCGRRGGCRRAGSSPKPAGPLPVPTPGQSNRPSWSWWTNSARSTGGFRRNRRSGMDGSRRRDCAVQPAPCLAQRAPPGQPAEAAAASGPPDERRRCRRLGRVALRCRPGREPAGMRHAGHGHWRGHGHGWPGGTRTLRRGRRIRTPDHLPWRTPLRMREPRVLGAVRLRQRPGARGPATCADQLTRRAGLCWKRRAELQKTSPGQP